MKKQIIAASLAACMVAGAQHSAPAVNETNGVAVLPPVVVEASRLSSSAGEMPVAVRVHTRSEVKASGARDVTDFVARANPGYSVLGMGAGNPALRNIQAAGYGENGFGRINVMVDGQSLNNADMSAPLLTQINLASVDRIEMLKGSQNVLHGDGASAGVINIVTEPQDYDFGGSVEAFAGNKNTYGARHSMHGGIEEDGIKWWNASGWERSDGFRENNGYELWNASGGLKKEWENGSFFRLSSFWNNTKYDLPGYAKDPDWKKHRYAANTPDDWYRRQTLALNGTLEMVANDENKVRIDSTYSVARMKARNCMVEWGYDSRMMYDLNTFEITPQWINSADVFGFENEFIAGAYYRYDGLDGEQWDTYGTDDSYDYNRNTMAYFAQETFHLSEMVALQVGGRWQRTWNENTKLVHPRRISNTFAADGAILVTPTDTVKTYVRFSRFYRSAFLDENPYSGGWVPERVLRPETGCGLNVGASWQATKELSLFADAGVSRTEDEIIYGPAAAGGFDNINAPSPVNRETLTLGTQWEKDKVAAASLAYTLVNAEFDGGALKGKAVPMCAESALTSTGRYWLCDEFSLLGGFRFISPQHKIGDFNNEGRKLPTVCTFHIGARYEPTLSTLKGFYVSGMIDNLFDRRYADYAVRGASGNEVYYPAAGRTFLLTVGWEF